MKYGDYVSEGVGIVEDLVEQMIAALVMTICLVVSYAVLWPFALIGWWRDRQQMRRIQRLVDNPPPAEPYLPRKS